MIRLPAEWEYQEGIWLSWPHNKKTWSSLLPEIETFYAQLCNHILKYEDIYMLHQADKVPYNCIQLVSESTHVLHMVSSPTNDCWIRDYGGITVEDNNGTPVMVNWVFNAWGEKYAPWHQDNNIPLIMAKQHNIPLVNVPLVLEGGSIDVNGQGVLLTTEDCLLHPNRNPQENKKSIEAALNTYMGIEKIIWLKGGIPGDDTDGHVDNIARFVNEKKIMCLINENDKDESYQPLKNNFYELVRNSNANDMEIIEIPAPSPVYVRGLRTPSSYLNFLIINGAVLVPVFKDKNDDKVLQIFKENFPQYAIVPIDCRMLSYGQGGLHCISMQVPQLRNVEKSGNTVTHTKEQL